MSREPVTIILAPDRGSSAIQVVPPRTFSNYRKRSRLHVEIAAASLWT